MGCLMDKNEIIWILECCLLSLDVSDASTLKTLKTLGAPEELAKVGIKLCEYLSHKELKV